MPSSFVVICNMALIRLGEAQITALTDDTVEAETCNTMYAQVVDEVLNGWDWLSSRHMASLTADATAPTFKWDYRYLMPSNPYCLRVLEVRNLYEVPIKYQIRGRYVQCDEEDGIYLSYSKRITDPTEIDPLLSQAISLRLASWMEPKFGDSITRRNSILSEFGGVILQAKMDGAIQDYSQDETERSADTEDGNSDWAQAGR